MNMSGEVKSAKVRAIQIMESLKWNSHFQNLQTMGEALEGFEDGLRSPWKQHSKQSENVSDIKKINIY